MPRFVNLPTTSGNEESVRVDRVETVRYSRVGLGLDIDKQNSVVATASGQQIAVSLPKPRVMELLGLHLANNGEEWV